MIKKCLFSLLIGAASLTTHGDDGDPVVPELNKLTKVSCYKDESSSPLPTADINYTSDDRISNTNLGVDKLLFIYSDGKFSVTGIHFGEVMEEYTLSGNVVTSRKISQESLYASNKIYASDEYSYRYSGPSWVLTSWNARWPKELGTGHGEKSYPEYKKRTWENGNMVLYVQSLDSREIRYEYSMAEAPKNFPLRAIGSFSPVGFKSITPLNLLYGIQSRNPPVRAYTYTIPDQGGVKAEYEYAYTTVGGYVTGMTIGRNNGGTVSSYKYTFEYNFVVK